MNKYQLHQAIGGVDADLIDGADWTRSPTRSRPIRPRRLARGALIAAALTVLLSLGAVAYTVLTHERTVALMEAGPMSSGRLRPTIGEAGKEIIESAAIDLGLSQQSNGTTVTLDSLMGYHDPAQSLLYLTFTVTPPEGFSFPEDMKDWCFWEDHFTLVPDDLPIARAASAVRNADGTASVLWVMMPMGNPGGHRLHIELGGFGTADKSVVASLYDGSREIELPGQWVFDPDLPDLPETRAVALDAAALREAGLPLTALRLNAFGGVAELAPVSPEETPYQPQSLTLRYPDGTAYTVSYRKYGDNLWLNWEDGQPFCQILFLDPQPIEEAVELVLDGVSIPLG